MSLKNTICLDNLTPEVLEKAFYNENIDLVVKYRYAYYCGQSYRDAHLTEKSTYWFKIFLDLPADNQYKYCACDNLGDNYKKLNNMEEALNYWYKAIPFDRERRETVVKIMEYYFSKGNNFAINMLYERMKNYKLTNPNGKIFLNMTRYHDIDYYNSIVSCYIGEWMSGYYSCKNLLLNDKRIEITLKNFTCYGYNVRLDQDNKPFLDKLLELFEIYFDSKKELVKKLWNMVSKHIKEYLPEQFKPLNDKYNDLNTEKVYIIANNKIPLEKASNKILIYTGFMNFLWNDSTLKEKSIGGSEKAVIYLSRCLPKNYEIYIAGHQLEEEIDNIKYVHHNNLQKLLNDNKFHTIIVSRYVSFFLLYPKFKCYQLYLTAQDFEYMNKLEGSNILPKTIIENNNDIIDSAVCLTKCHKNNTEVLYPMFKDKLETINNGINPQDFKFDCNQKINNKFVWTSCAYRGLEILLDLWPKILEKLPDATLDIASYNTFPNNESEIKMKVIIDNHDSITHHGKLNTEELYQLTSTAEYWLYTNTFAETSCITGMEMLMNEVICLYYPLSGLVDTVGEYGIKVEGGNELETILNLSEERKTELKKNGKAYALTCSWENRAKEWSSLLGLQNLLYTVDNYDNQQSIKFLTYPPNKCIISEVISKNQVWEPHMHRIFEKYINKESIVLEGGCHIGSHSLRLGLLGKRVLSFEPMITSNTILRKNLKINKITNVTVYDEGLSNNPEEAYFETSQINNPGGSALSNNPMGVAEYAKMINSSKYPVKLITIDSLQLDKLDFIKLDVEGYEINVIEGAINTIKRCKPIITLESWKNHFGEVCLQHTKNTFKILLDNGYSMEHIEGPDFLFLPYNQINTNK